MTIERRLKHKELAQRSLSIWRYLINGSSIIPLALAVFYSPFCIYVFDWLQNVP